METQSPSVRLPDVRPANPPSNTQDPMRQAAEDLESAFLAEMLKSAGLGKARDSFGGGAGEDHFSSFLVEAQAKQITKAGGIGLAESLYNALKDAENE